MHREKRKMIERRESIEKNEVYTHIHIKEETPTLLCDKAFYGIYVYCIHNIEYSNEIEIYI